MQAIAPRRKRVMTAALALVGLMAGLVGVSPLEVEAANAAPAYGGVRIIDQHGDPVSGAYVELRPSSGSSDRYAMWTATDGVGRVPWYLTTDVAAMLTAMLPYQADPQLHYNWVGGTALQLSSSAPTTVATFSPSSSVLLELVAPLVLPAGQLRGTITLGTSTLGAEAAVIDLHSADTGVRLMSARPESDGSFVFTHVPHGRYKLLFQSYASKDGAPNGFTPRWITSRRSARSGGTQ